MKYNSHMGMDESLLAFAAVEVKLLDKFCQKFRIIDVVDFALDIH